MFPIRILDCLKAPQFLRNLFDAPNILLVHRLNIFGSTVFFILNDMGFGLKFLHFVRYFEF